MTVQSQERSKTKGRATPGEAVAAKAKAKGSKLSVRNVKKAATKKTTAKKKPFVFDKYSYYLEAVQSPEGDVEFFRDTYKELRGRLPKVLREDFCGTFSLCCEWTKLGSAFVAHGVDLDPEPVEYGRQHYMSKLNAAQKSRVNIQLQNVLNPGLPKADVVCAMNFSHFIFKRREDLKAYFANCLATLNPGGVLISDSFGGSLCQEANEEKQKRNGFTYYWHQASFDPISANAVFHIHFKPDGRPKIEKVFTYDWRMWTLPELREIMLEAGFKKTHIYWEGSNRKGAGNGIFKRVEKGEDCQAWIAYVVGEK